MPTHGRRHDGPTGRAAGGLDKRILEDCRNPGRLIELYYWSAEHDLADVMRQYIAVTVQIAENGEMTFSAPAAAELAKRIMNPEVPPSFLH